MLKGPGENTECSYRHVRGLHIINPHIHNTKSQLSNRMYRLQSIDHNEAYKELYVDLILDT